MASLALESFIDETVRLSGQNGYHPTTFIGMRQRHGTVKAISRLVENGDVQSGFKRLQELGLLDWTIEAAVIKFPAEFSPATRQCAEFRLGLAKVAAPAAPLFPAAVGTANERKGHGDR